jgi:hypothetical protein
LNDGPTDLSRASDADEKSKGKEVTISAAAPQRDGKVVGIMEALKRSMERIPAKKNPRFLVPLRRKKDCQKPETNRLDQSGFTARESVDHRRYCKKPSSQLCNMFDIPSFSPTFSTIGKSN